MINAFTRAFAQMFDPRILRIIVLSVVVTGLVYGALIAGLIWGLGQVHFAETGWLDTLARWGTGTGAVLLAGLFFPGAVSAVMTLWQDTIAAAVETRHYPALPPARATPVIESLAAGLRLLGLTVALNMAMLPLYIVLFFAPPLNVVVFIAVNGFLLGREYFEAVALRHMTHAEAMLLRQRYRGKIWLAGCAAAVLLTVPGLNLIAPVIATMAFVHLTQDIQ